MDILCKGLFSDGILGKPPLFAAHFCAESWNLGQGLADIVAGATYSFD
jgi:hypothetical protein